MEEKEWEETGNDCLIYHKNILTMCGGTFIVTKIIKYSYYNICNINSEYFENYKDAKRCFEEEY